MINDSIAVWLRINQNELALAVIENQFEREEFNDAEWKAWFRDVQNHILYLADAIELRSPENFNGYILWFSGMQWR